MDFAIYENTSLNTAFKIPWILLRLWLRNRNNCSFSSSLPQFYTQQNTLSTIKSIDTSILNHNSNFTKTLVFRDLLNSATIDTLILLLQMLLLFLFYIPKDLMCLSFSIYRHGYLHSYYFVKLLVIHFLLF